MFGHILIPLDGSRASEAIIPHMTDLAKRLNAAVTLVRVVNTMGAVQVAASERGAVGGPRTVDEVRRRGERVALQYLERQAQGIRCFNVPSSVTVRSGDPAAEILEAARACHADCIAMATHSRRGLDRLMLGSVAERVLHTARVPVILLRAE